MQASRPPARTTDGETELANCKAFRSKDLLSSLVVEPMLAGVATRSTKVPVGLWLGDRVRSPGAATGRVARSAMIPLDANGVGTHAIRRGLTVQS